MSRLIFSPANTDDVAWLAPRLRKADLREIEAASGRHPAQALRAGLEASDAPMAVIEHGRPIAMFGVVPALPGRELGAPWLLGTDRILANWREFVRLSRPTFAKVTAPYTSLRNHVDRRNTVHVRWLRWLGAEFHACEPYGHAGLPFWSFSFDLSLWRARYDPAGPNGADASALRRLSSEESAC